MKKSQASLAIRYVVWYEGDDDREDKEFRSMKSAQSFASSVKSREPIIDVIEDGHLVESYHWCV